MAEKNKTGRPTKYKEEFCDALVEYYDKEPVTDGKPTDLPVVVGFCRTIGISKDTFYAWVKKYDTFSDAYKKAQTMQEHILITNGLAGRYDKTFAIFAAKNLIGWKDKQEVDLNAGISIKWDKDVNGI